MPSTKPLPTVRDFLLTGQQAVVGQVDAYADVRPGSMYDHINGPYATLMARQAVADRDKFRAIYISSAQGDDLSRIVVGRLGVPRIQGAYGQGTCAFQRPSDAGGGGTFWQGTRIQVSGNPPGLYQVAVDTVADPFATSITIPIEATVTGPATAVSGATSLSMVDPIWDATWAPISLSCAPGTDYESASDYVARARATLFQNRNGYLAKLQAACASVGAVNAIGFASSAGLGVDDLQDDYGLNAIYVADANFASNQAMVQAATIALESCRVLGADLWVGGIQQVNQAVIGTVNLIDSPGNLPQIVISRACLQAVLGYFPAYVTKVQALESAIASASPYIQSVTLAVPSADTSVPTVTFSGGGIFVPSVLTSYVWPDTLDLFITSANQVNLTLAGPV